MCSSRFLKFLSTSIFDFSVITNPNRVIFDSTDRSLSLLSKNTIFPNFSPQFIVQFDQILKDISKISKFPVDSTRIYHYTLNSLLIPQIGKFGIIFDTRPCEIDDLAVSSHHRGEMRSSLGVVKLGILHLRLSRGLDARGCRLLWRRSVIPWWRRGSYATNPPGVGRTRLRRVSGCVGQRLEQIRS